MKLIKTGIFFLLFSAIISCKSEDKKTVQQQQPTISRPAFDGDKAYNFVEKQVEFGPRVPGTPEHKAASEWLVSQLGEFVDSAFIQTGEATMYSGNQIPIYNVIGQMNKDNSRRILLAAHWDTRHIADKDQDEADKDQPILGANDGASGVGVLLEIARQLRLTDSKLGVDIIFFDAEDLGKPDTSDVQKSDTWCLGSQYWAQNPHEPNYQAGYGILLDMVGAQDAVFKFENRAYSQAAPLYTKTWNTAAALGYNSYFVKQPGGSLTDDHIYVMLHRKFPMINIIDFDPTRANGYGFGDFHHTSDDNMDIISKMTLQAVGETVLATIQN